MLSTNRRSSCSTAKAHPQEDYTNVSYEVPKPATANIGPVPEPFINTPEVAMRTDKSIRTVMNWMNEGILPYYKVGRSVLFKWSEVESHLRETCRVPARTANSEPQ